MTYYAQYASPVGMLLLSFRDDALTGLWMECSPEQGWSENDAHPVLLQARDWLDRYFRGEAPAVDIPLAPEGTAFQKLVWDILLDIPYGRTRTYGEIAKEMARKLGKEKMSAQAVGGAVGKNPISILIPCHRVVGSGGKLTGYAGGLHQKEWLLKHEKGI